MAQKPEPAPKAAQSRPAGAGEILQFIAASNGPVSKREIAQAFGMKGADRIGLKKLLKDMADKGEVRLNRKGFAACSDVPDEHRAKMLRVPPAGSDKLLGLLRLIKGKGARIVPVDKKAKLEYQVLPGDEAGAENGELVRFEIIRQRGFGLPAARVKQRLGDMRNPRNIALIAINQHGIENVFPDKVLAEASSLKPFTQAGRKDFTATPLITIDPDDARDHDDAVFASPDETPGNSGGFNVIVAIADVAVYVRPGTALDRNAGLRGNSVYFPDLVVPMLPERISNDLCSLREKELRPALVCVMRFNKLGQKIAHYFERITMRSAANLSYEEAQGAINGRKNKKTDALLEPVLKPLWAAYRILKKAQDARAPLALDLPERKIILDAQGYVARIVVPQRLDAHRLIEEFMIQANVAAAEELEKRKISLLYRVHESPSQEKLKALAQFLKTVNRDLSLGQVVTPSHFNRLLHSVKGEDFERLVHDVVLRTQAQATYAAQNAGHFGLALRRYAHFTSPIRRYADLIVHRALISALRLGSDGLSQEDISGLDETADMISAAERRAMLAERETQDRLIASYLEPQTGAIFNGRISGVVGAGLFVRLDESGADGFVPAASLGADYFVFDEARHALVASRSGETFQLGDHVRVKLMEVAPIRGGLRFEMVSDGRPGKPTPGRRQWRKNKKR